MRRTLPLVLEGDLPGSAAGKLYAEIAQRLLDECGTTGALLVTSPSCGDGRSTTAANLCLALIARKVPTLLLELTDSRTRLDVTFGTPRGRIGVEDILRGREELDAVIYRRSDTGLYLAMMRRCVPLDLQVPARQQCFRRLLAYARQRCAWVVIDGPSGRDASSVQVLAENVSKTLIVSNQRRTRRSALAAQINELEPFAPSVVMTAS